MLTLNGSLKLQVFDFSIEHRKGSENDVPDAIFRIFMAELFKDHAPLHVDLSSTAFQHPEYLNRLDAVDKTRMVIYK